MDFLAQLNPEQRAAVLHTEGPVLILAGAGSGKTRVIAFRIAYLIGAGFAEARQVLAVTFTNKAAEEMRERVRALLHAGCEGAWISTFHALCARLLRREAPAIGLTRDFVIYDQPDQLAAVKQAMRELDVDERWVPPRQALARISQAAVCVIASSINTPGMTGNSGKWSSKYSSASDNALTATIFAPG